jgi:hypothetical protein
VAASVDRNPILAIPSSWEPCVWSLFPVGWQPAHALSHCGLGIWGMQEEGKPSPNVLAPDLMRMAIFNEMIEKSFSRFRWDLR